MLEYILGTWGDFVTLENCHIAGNEMFTADICGARWALDEIAEFIDGTDFFLNTWYLYIKDDTVMGETHNGTIGYKVRLIAR